MRLRSRTFLPLFLAALLGLAGCQNLNPTRSPTAPSPTANAAVVEPVGIYLAQTEPAPELVMVRVPDGLLYLHRSPLLTRDDLTDAAALADRQGQPFVGLRLTADGTRKLSTASHANQGHLLALVISRELVAAPRITRPLDQGILAFEVPSVQAAKTLAARIRGDMTPTP